MSISATQVIKLYTPSTNNHHSYLLHPTVTYKTHAALAALTISINRNKLNDVTTGARRPRTTGRAAQDQRSDRARPLPRVDSHSDLWGDNIFSLTEGVFAPPPKTQAAWSASFHVGVAVCPYGTIPKSSAWRGVSRGGLPSTYHGRRVLSVASSSLLVCQYSREGA